MNITFTVGEFAKLNNLKKQTLIYYDNIGLFKPNIVDAINGYRYYTADQLEVLDSILILREIGVSIKDIKLFLENRDSKKTLDLLQEQLFKLKIQAKNINILIKKLESKISTLQKIDNISNTVSFIELDSEFLALEDVSSPNTLLETDLALKKLFKNIDEKGHYYTYQIGTIVSKESLQNKDYLKAKYVFLPLSKKESGIKVHKRNKGLYATLYHKGRYESIGTSYEKLLSSISEYGFTPLSDSYEYSILDSLTSSTTTEYITKIIIRVK